MSFVLHIEKHHPLRPKERYRFAAAGLRVIKIGTLRSAHVPLDESSASGLQATIRLNGGRAYLQTIGRQPVLLNDAQLDKNTRVEIFSDDTLQIGSTTLSVRLRLAEDDTTPAMPTQVRAALRGMGDVTAKHVLAAIHRRRTPGRGGEALEERRDEQSERGDEKYNTGFLVAQVRRERRNRGMLVLALVACAVAMAGMMVGP